jgi:hypothetical protein
MQRILEPEVMDTSEEAIEYDAMDFTAVNTHLHNVLASWHHNRVSFSTQVQVLPAFPS